MVYGGAILGGGAVWGPVDIHDNATLHRYTHHRLLGDPLIE